MLKFVNKSIIRLIVCLVLCFSFLVVNPCGRSANSAETEAYDSTSLIRFHVIANSDNEQDQLLKYAVRDEVLKAASPNLAESQSLAESREILLSMENQLLEISRRVVKEWGKTYPVTLEYGVFAFPTKSYGNIVLPAGDYEAVEIKIGNAEGANWWCVLFPPLCFVNVEESTSLPVDGKPAVPLNTAAKQKKPTYQGKEIGFFLERFF
ncbi:stage II sporulation protein R [Dehalobacter sp. MCB1]|uniref:stage II sporulation protein R n=1 Tax=Dehalobacter sp. MCB1 TaxID=1844756 RepID=UPI000E6CDCAE|nr:stage II sporulation protein R [Dehalobacter sp. MCB1]RJE47643.1 stage II sporulation protein R [Dehalobacter sp. MCB1]